MELDPLYCDVIVSPAKTKEGADHAVCSDIPVLWVGWNEPAILARLEREYLTFNNCKSLDVAFRDGREGNLFDRGVHVVNGVAEASPNLIERICAVLGDDSLLNKKIEDVRTLHIVVEFDPFAFDDESPNSLGDRMGHHDSAEKVSIRVKIDAFSRSRSEIVVGNDVLVRDFKAAIDALFKRTFKVSSQPITYHPSFNMFCNSSHAWMLLGGSMCVKIDRKAPRPRQPATCADKLTLRRTGYQRPVDVVLSVA